MQPQLIQSKLHIQTIGVMKNTVQSIAKITNGKNIINMPPSLFEL